MLNAQEPGEFKLMPRSKGKFILDTQERLSLVSSPGEAAV
jgi:hypothetical protein